LSCLRDVRWTAGVLVRRVHADRLEKEYDESKNDHYLFAVDQAEYIIDATKSGGMCRFVNHSCGCASCAWGTVQLQLGLFALRKLRSHTRELRFHTRFRS
jgi:SET domain-containing protein